jgi:glycosyltransferase involved in cell wall biosynthesis
MGRDLSLSVFFPCHNEQDNVERTTRAALAVAPAVSTDHEIIIVNDASTDDTGRIAERLAAEHPTVRVVHNPVCQGYGGALRAGFRAATREWVFYTDGDGQFDFAELPRLIEKLDRCDIVSAYRVNRCESRIRRFNTWAWTVLCNLTLGLRLRDIDCAFKLFPRRLFDEIPLCSLGALIDAEILARAQRRGYRIGQIGVRHYPRLAGQASGADPRVVVRAFVELFHLRRDILRKANRPSAGSSESPEETR